MSPREEVQLLEAICERQERRVQHLENSIYQLANFYLVFQGVVLAAISQGSSLECKHWWIPFILSLMAAIVNGFAFAYTIIKYLRTKEALYDDWEQLLNKRKSMDGPMPTKKLEFDTQMRGWRHLYVGVTVVALILFSIFMFAACRLIVCNKKKCGEGKD